MSLNISMYINKSGYRGGDRGLSPPEQFQGGTVPPPEICPPPEQFRGGDSRPPPELNPVSAPVCVGTL